MKQRKPKKILVVSPFASHPNDVGNRSRLYHFLKQLKKQGNDICFLYAYHSIINPKDKPTKQDIKAMKKEWKKVYIIPPNFKTKFSEIIFEIDKKIGQAGLIFKQIFPNLHAQQQKLRKNFKKPFKQKTVDHLYNKKIDNFLKKLKRKYDFDIILAQYIFFSKALNLFKDKLKLIDTHDQFSNRRDIFLKKGIDYRGLSCTQEEEAKAINRADIIIAIQNEEAKFLKKLADKNKKIVIISHIQNIKSPIKRTSKRKNLFFVGQEGFPNKEAVLFIINKILPKLKQKYPETKLVLAGNISKTITKQKNIIRLGKVKNIEKAYSLADIVVTPMFTQTGQSIKNVEALAHSLPLVTTKKGARGIEKGKNKAFLIANTEKEFIKGIDKILSNKNYYEKLSKNAHTFMKEYNKKNIDKIQEIFQK